MQQLEAILEDSAASMGAQHSAPAGGPGDQARAQAAASMSGNSRAQKTAWWRARLGLDERLRALLQRLDSGCLGPWRCVPRMALSQAHLCRHLKVQNLKSLDRCQRSCLCVMIPGDDELSLLS